MRFTKTDIPDVIIVDPKVFEDHRGFFMETWEARKFARAGIDVNFVQDNHSKSFQGTLRGLHYQIQHPQGKLVRVVAGEVFDVVVDLRRSSPTFGKWAGVYLSSENKRQIWVPPGFAHGFYVLSDSAEFIYKCTDFYAPEHERTILWNDQSLGIAWPILPDVPLRLSEKDERGIPFHLAEYYP
jgi:dTDP-4-dehydrorhamnose 3,5-epimerase